MNPFISSGLLAASMFLGQPGEPSTGGNGVIVAPPSTIQQTQAQTPGQPQPSSRPILGWFAREDRPVMSRLTGWFKRDQKDVKKEVPNNYPGRDEVIRETVVPSTIRTSPTQPTDFPRRMPQPQSRGSSSRDAIARDASSNDIQQATLRQVALTKNIKSPILPQFADKIGRDEKFEWITGQFEIENGNHVLYYSTPEVVDPYHGRVVLLPEQGDFKQFKKGDLVSLRGQLVQRPTSQGIVPIYRVKHASMIERPKMESSAGSPSQP